MSCALLACSFPPLALGGCTVGPATSVTDAGSSNTNAGHNVTRSVYTDADGNPVNWTAVTTGSTSEIDQGETGVTGNYAGPIPNSGTIFIPGTIQLDASGKPVLDADGSPVFGKPRSVSFVAASDMSMKIGKLSTPDGMVLQDFAWSVKTSESIRAMNEALDRFKEIWPRLSEEQRKALEAAVNQIAPGLFRVLETLATGALAVRDAPVDTEMAVKLRDVLNRV